MCSVEQALAHLTLRDWVGFVGLGVAFVAFTPRLRQGARRIPGLRQSIQTMIEANEQLRPFIHIIQGAVGLYRLVQLDG